MTDVLLILGTVAVFVVALAVLLTVTNWQPDDPWMLEHEHLMRSHWCGPEEAPWDHVDHALQEAAAERRENRDKSMGKVHLEHSSMKPLMRGM